MSRLIYGTPLPLKETASDEHLLAELTQIVDRRASNRLSRRSFLGAAGLGAGAAIVAGCGGNSPTTTTPTTPTPTPAPASEVEVLNFALNLEYLEASFYLYIATGSGLPAAYMGTSPGAVTGTSPAVTFTDPNVAALALQLAYDEQAHVNLIRSTIANAGSTPVDMPALNLAALGPITSDATFLAIARQLETVGISAYEGGITAFVSDINGLGLAATIHDTEAQHEGTLRQFCIAKGITSAAVDSSDIPPTLATVFNTNSNGLNAVRTPSQVLQIVYAAPGQTGVSSGGFYPNGMNGSITTS